jgi:hypothetical protein
VLPVREKVFIFCIPLFFMFAASPRIKLNLMKKPNLKKKFKGKTTLFTGRLYSFKSSRKTPVVNDFKVLLDRKMFLLKQKKNLKQRMSLVSSELIEGIESRIELIDFELVKTNSKLKELKRLNSERLKSLKKNLKSAETSLENIEKKQNSDPHSRINLVKTSFEKKADKIRQEIQKESQRIQSINKLIQKYSE